MHFLLTAFTFPHCTPFFHSFSSFFPFSYLFSYHSIQKKLIWTPGRIFLRENHYIAFLLSCKQGMVLSIDLYIKLETVFIREHDQTECNRIKEIPVNGMCFYIRFLRTLQPHIISELKLSKFIWNRITNADT